MFSVAIIHPQGLSRHFLPITGRAGLAGGANPRERHPVTYGKLLAPLNADVANSLP